MLGEASLEAGPAKAERRRHPVAAWGAWRQAAALRAPWARSLGDVVGDCREREVRRCVVVVMGLDRTKVSFISFREPARAVQTDIV